MPVFEQHQAGDAVVELADGTARRIDGNLWDATVYRFDTGAQTLAQRLTAHLPTGTVRLGSTVTSVSHKTGLGSSEIQRLQRRTTASLSLAQVIGSLSLAVVSTIGVLGGYGQRVWAGLARTGSTLGAALAGIPLANLAVRHGRRWALGTGWLVAAAGSALLVLAPPQPSRAALGAFLGGPTMTAIGYNGLVIVSGIALVPICVLLAGRRLVPVSGHRRPI